MGKPTDNTLLISKMNNLLKASDKLFSRNNCVVDMETIRNLNELSNNIKATLINRGCNLVWDKKGYAREASNEF
jgi:hypothetical protein